ncbi:EAL domain-containing protein [Pediococcus stilesii]|nr:EAL domain-containing protein [Pediococcus stilesii]
MYRFFIQPQLNTQAQAVVGYELLMKEYRDGRWQMPASFSDISAKTIAETLIATARKLSLKVGSVSINVDRFQIQDQKLLDALVIAQGMLRPVKLVIELIESAVKPAVSNAKLIQIANGLNEVGIQFCLDDVGSGINTWPEIEPLLPYACELKYALQNYKEHLDQAETDRRVSFWRNIANVNSIRFVLEGIDNDRDDAWADLMKIDLRQGYYYGKPSLMKINADDPD